MISVPESCLSRTYCCEGIKLLWSPASLWMPCTLHSIIQFSGNSWQDSKQEAGKIFEGIQFRARNCIRGYTEPETVSEVTLSQKLYRRLHWARNCIGDYTEPETVSEVTLSQKLYWGLHITIKLVLKPNWCEGRNNLMWAFFFFLPLQSLQSRISTPYGVIPSSDNS